LPLPLIKAAIFAKTFAFAYFAAFGKFYITLTMKIDNAASPAYFTRGDEVIIAP